MPGLRLVTFALLSLTLTASARPAFADEPQQQSTATVKAAVTKIGTGVGARVVVVTRGGAKVRGFVSQAGGESFVVVRTEEAYLGQEIVIPYADVVSLKGKGVSLKGVGLKSTRGALVALSVLRVLARGVSLRLPP